MSGFLWTVSLSKLCSHTHIHTYTYWDNCWIFVRKFLLKITISHICSYINTCPTYYHIYNVCVIVYTNTYNYKNMCIVYLLYTCEQLLLTWSTTHWPHSSVAWQQKTILKLRTLFTSIYQRLYRKVEIPLTTTKIIIG